MIIFPDYIGYGVIDNLPSRCHLTVKIAFPILTSTITGFGKPVRYRHCPRNGRRVRRLHLPLHNSCGKAQTGEPPASTR